jgi:hypothetical protein
MAELVETPMTIPELLEARAAYPHDKWVQRVCNTAIRYAAMSGIKQEVELVSSARGRDGGGSPRPE